MSAVSTHSVGWAGRVGAGHTRGPRPAGGAVAVVLGGGALEVIRALRLAGIRCAVVTAGTDPAAHAARTRLLFDWDWTQSEQTHDERLVNRLLAWAWTQPEAPALFYSSDQALLFVSRYRRDLERGFRFVAPDAELVEALADKARFAALANRLGLSVPPTRVLAGRPSDPPPEVSGLGFPLLIKSDRRGPAWRAVTNSAGAEVKVVVESEEHWARVWPVLAGRAGTLLAQRFILGREGAIESYHVYIDHGGGIAAEFTGVQIRTWPLECGVTSACTVSQRPDVIRLGRELVEALGFRGVAKFDFKRDPDGGLHLLEITARPSLWHHPGARAGVNIPAIIYADLTATARPAATSRVRRVRWVHPKDFRAARAAGQSVIRWLLFAAGCRAKAFWSWRDPTLVPRVALSRLTRR